MSNDPDNADAAAGSRPPEQPATAARAGDADDPSRRQRVWVPSARLTAGLACAMLAIGVAVGAAIGPAPEASFAGASRLPLLLPALIAQATGANARTGAAGRAASIPAASAVVRRRRRRHALAAASPAASEPATPAESSTPTESTTPASSKGTGNGETRKAAALPPVTKVWVIQLVGSTFAEALAAPASAPYIDTKAVPAGALLSGWSSLQAGAFAGDAALIATSEPQLVTTVLQPLCPEGAAGAQCAPDTPGALKSADEFLSQTIPAITSNSAYRSSGLIVITFGASAAGAASGLPSGSTTATLGSQPPSGALLISPFATAGARPATPFNPASPTQSLEALLHR